MGETLARVAFTIEMTAAFSLLYKLGLRTTWLMVSVDWIVKFFKLPDKMVWETADF